MERQLKERIVGATVIVALGIIIIPWLLDGPAQTSRPVERALELPPAESAGRTFTIPLDPAAGPPMPVETGNEVQATAPRPGVGAVQRPTREPPVEATSPRAEVEPAPAPRVAPQPAQPSQPAPQQTPRTAPQPAPQAATAQPATEGPWTVQVGSFSQQQNAESVRARLASQGFEAFVSRVATDAGTMFRVRVGPVPDRAAADRLLTRVRAAGHGDARVVRAQD